VVKNRFPRIKYGAGSIKPGMTDHEIATGIGFTTRAMTKLDSGTTAGMTNSIVFLTSRDYKTLINLLYWLQFNE
jgi:hypothetical protein